MKSAGIGQGSVFIIQIGMEPLESQHEINFISEETKEEQAPTPMEDSAPALTMINTMATK